ncbi:MAG TPA: GtrA family protein [Acholeplasma sp.]|jgi:putative flippase GtrA|nr:GtrA family protein [Acholeplasma sp.]
MEDKKTAIQAIKFTLFSISAGIIQVASFAILNELLPIFDGEYGINYVVSLLLSIIWNFTFNRKFTFKASNDVKKAMLLVLLFYLVFTPVSAILGTMAEARGTNEYIVLGITMLFNFVLEFLYSKYIVFKEK